MVMLKCPDAGLNGGGSHGYFGHAAVEVVSEERRVESMEGH